MLTILNGNIFVSDRQTLVNAVNCVGVMGAGIALEFKLRYPAMFRRYDELCRQGRMEVGKLWLYKPKTAASDPWILNFPTKRHWRLPSKMEYLERGLENFVTTYRRRGIQSAAFPTLGSQHGGLSETRVLALMETRLSECDIPVDIYRYDPAAKDDLIDSLKSKFRGVPVRDLAAATGIDAHRVSAIQRALEQSDVRSVGQLAATRGVGEKTLTRTFAWMREEEPGQIELAL